MEGAEGGVDELGGRESLDEGLGVEEGGEEGLEGGEVGMRGWREGGDLQEGDGGEEACCSCFRVCERRRGIYQMNVVLCNASDSPEYCNDSAAASSASAFSIVLLSCSTLVLETEPHVSQVASTSPVSSSTSRALEVSASWP